MDPSRNSEAIEPEVERIKDEGKQWAGNVTDDNAWDSLLLTLDGGGIRGYSSLLILLELMKRIQRWEKKINTTDIDLNELLPCHYFDYIWGTSTGGLIAIMLGRLRMSVPQALSVYREVGEKIFGRKQKRALGGLNVFAARYNHQDVQSVVNTIVLKHCKEHATGTCSADRLLWTDMKHHNVDNHWHLCQAACVTARVDGKNHQALPLRTYPYVHHESLTSPDPYGGVEDADILIWEAGRATSAAPVYFKHFEKRDGSGKLRRYRDGGILLNNPSHRVLNEVRNRHGLMANGVRKDPALLFSVGTGIQDKIPFAEIPDAQHRTGKLDIPFRQSIKQKVALGKHLLMRYTEGESIHRRLREDVAAEHKWYKRLNVDRGLGNMDLGDWRKGEWTDENGVRATRKGGATLTDMEQAVGAYVERQTLNRKNQIEWHLLPSTLIDHTAERLVRHKAKRASLAALHETYRERWYCYRGRCITGELAEDWNDESFDGPYERSPE